MQMVKQKHDKTNSAKPMERLKWFLLYEHISCIFYKESGQMPKY